VKKLGIVLTVGSTDHHLRAPLHEPRSGRRWARYPAIDFAARHHGPDDPGHLVSQSNRHDLPRLALQQFHHPCIGTSSGLAPNRVAEHRHGAEHQQLAQPFVTAARDAAQALLAAT
jgi:hypothetical protein